ncbi:MAG: DUF1489 domain-containing protein [Rhodospirillaceae bacterium]|nr:DUF1489 domain-containing protein [Rhodospirillaceae bacterium]
MAVHLIKLAVGVEDIAQLRTYQAARAQQLGLSGAVPGFTRRKPKRAEEIIGAGSLYWVIKGQVRARQRILDLADEVDAEGRPFCRLLLHPQVIEVQPTPKRPFQGWRYLKPADAPPDLAQGDDGDPLPPGLAENLRDLGVF